MPGKEIQHMTKANEKGHESAQTVFQARRWAHKPVICFRIKARCGLICSKQTFCPSIAQFYIPAPF